MVCSWVKLLGLVVLWIVTTGGWLDFLKKPTERWRGTGQIDTFERQGNTLKVYGSSSESTVFLIDGRVFNGLRPDDTFEDVKKVLGRPLEIKKPDSSRTELIYQNKYGKLSVIKSGDRNYMHKWIEFYPYNVKPENTVSSSITSQLDPSWKTKEIYIYDCPETRYKFLVKLKNGLIDNISWVDNSKYRIRKDGSCTPL